MNMKTITFTVTIQADLPTDGRTKKAVALHLCHNINNILSEYDGVMNAARVIPAPTKIKVTNTPDD